MSEEPLNSAQSHPPEKLSIAEFLKKNGVEEFGTVFQGEVISTATEKSRLTEIEADGSARRLLGLLNFIVKDALVHVVGIILVLGLAAITSLTLFDDEASSQEKEWARAMLSAIGGSVAGYVFGKGSSKA
jgi:hypothetical protein